MFSFCLLNCPNVPPSGQVACVCRQHFFKVKSLKLLKDRFWSSQMHPDTLKFFWSQNSQNRSLDHSLDHSRTTPLANSGPFCVPVLWWLHPLSNSVCTDAWLARCRGRMAADKTKKPVGRRKGNVIMLRPMRLRAQLEAVRKECQERERCKGRY